jgi:hypothetical protein
MYGPRSPQTATQRHEYKQALGNRDTLGSGVFVWLRHRIGKAEWQNDQQFRAAHNRERRFTHSGAGNGHAPCGSVAGPASGCRRAGVVSMDAS